MKKIVSTLVLLSGLTFAQGASSATFDFAYIAEYVPPYEYGSSSISFSDGGINLTASASNTAGTTAYNAYLDEYSGGLAGGLGVCKTLTTGNQCAPNSDDNVSGSERLILTFDQTVTITDTWFRNGDHGTSFYSDPNSTSDNILGIWIDNIYQGAFPLASLFTLDLTGTTFWFDNISGSSAADKVFYISQMNVSAVPVPAAVWLFGSGIAGLIGFGKRKKASLSPVAA